MKHRLGLPFLVFFLTLSSTALASTTWYVDGVKGNDSNGCKSPQHACKTITHAISLASSGDSIMVAAATYTENLTIGFSLKIVGSGAKTTIIDGGGIKTVVADFHRQRPCQSFKDDNPQRRCRDWRGHQQLWEADDQRHYRQRE
jgi:hypothetical protein